jgi:hypothetical protein
MLYTEMYSRSFCHESPSPQTVQHKTTTGYGTGNPDPGLGKAQTCGGLQPVNEIPILCFAIEF